MTTPKPLRAKIEYVIFDMDGLLSERGVCERTNAQCERR